MKVELGQWTGYVFKGEHVDTPCFVPVHLVTFSADGAAHVDHVAYFAEGWSVRNCRCSDTDLGCAHVFPDESCPVEDATASGLSPMLDRFRRLLASSARPLGSLN